MVMVHHLPGSHHGAVKSRSPCASKFFAGKSVAQSEMTYEIRCERGPANAEITVVAEDQHYCRTQASSEIFVIPRNQAFIFTV